MPRHAHLMADYPIVEVRCIGVVHEPDLRDPIRAAAFAWLMQTPRAGQ